MPATAAVAERWHSTRKRSAFCCCRWCCSRSSRCWFSLGTLITSIRLGQCCSAAICSWTPVWRTFPYLDLYFSSIFVWNPLNSCSLAMNTEYRHRYVQMWSGVFARLLRCLNRNPNGTNITNNNTNHNKNGRKHSNWLNPNGRTGLGGGHSTQPRSGVGTVFGGAGRAGGMPTKSTTVVVNIFNSNSRRNTQNAIGAGGDRQQQQLPMRNINVGVGGGSAQPAYWKPSSVHLSMQRHVDSKHRSKTKIFCSKHLPCFWINFWHV